MIAHGFVQTGKSGTTLDFCFAVLSRGEPVSTTKVECSNLSQLHASGLMSVVGHALRLKGGGLQKSVILPGIRGRAMAKPTLFVMAPSHYCERARWGLDHKRIPYEERAWPPGLHVMFARRVKAKATSLPILAADGQVVQGSGAILAWAGLDGGDEPLEHRFETVTGVLIRQYIYSGTLHDENSGIRELLLHSVPSMQASITRAGWPVLRRVMAKGLDARPDLRPELERRIDAELDWVDTLVGHGGALKQGGFGRAAITSASLLAPLAQPDAIPLYRQVRMPADMTQAYARWSARPALRWVNETYAKHRH